MPLSKSRPRRPYRGPWYDFRGATPQGAARAWRAPCAAQINPPHERCLVRYALLSILLAGCAATRGEVGREPTPSPRAAESRERVPSGATARQRGPIASELIGPQSAVVGQPFELHARIERRMVLDAPVRVTLRLPDHVTLLEGRADQWLEASLAPDTRELVFTLQASDLPDGDVTLVIDVQGRGGGYHAELPYRFGRPAPLPVPPARTGPSLRIRGRNFGRSVQVSGDGP